MLLGFKFRQPLYIIGHCITQNGIALADSDNVICIAVGKMCLGHRKWFFLENAINKAANMRIINMHVKENRQAISSAVFRPYYMNRVNEGEWATLKAKKIDLG